MVDACVSRRSLLMGGATVTAWAASPVSAILRTITLSKDAASIDTLIGQMTLGEKAGQLSLMASAWGAGVATVLNPAGDNSSFAAQVAAAVASKLTGVFNGNGAAMAMQTQRAVMSGSRLTIPLIFGADIIYGHRTIFPVPVAETASFEPALAGRTARVAAFEAAGSGVDWTFAPMVDIARDQRWSRRWKARARTSCLTGCSPPPASVGFRGSTITVWMSANARCVTPICARSRQRSTPMRYREWPRPTRFRECLPPAITGKRERGRVIMKSEDDVISRSFGVSRRQPVALRVRG